MSLALSIDDHASQLPLHHRVVVGIHLWTFCRLYHHLESTHAHLRVQKLLFTHKHQQVGKLFNGRGREVKEVGQTRLDKQNVR